MNLTENDLRLQRPEDTWLWSGGIPANRYNPVGLYCPSGRRSRVEVYDKRYRFPRARQMWTRSVSRSQYQSYEFVGKRLRDTRRIQISGDRLIIRELEEADEGIYRFGYEYEPDQFSTICFFPVYLSDKVQVRNHNSGNYRFALHQVVESGNSFTLNCNALGLWPIIQQTPNDKWKTYWTYKPDEKAVALGTKPMKELWLTGLKPPYISDSGDIFPNASGEPMVMTLFDTEERRFDSVQYSMSGHYKCIVQSSPKGLEVRRFVTNSFKLIVTSPPTVTGKVRHAGIICSTIHLLNFDKYNLLYICSLGSGF